MEYTDLYSYIYKDRVILLQVDLEIYIDAWSIQSFTGLIEDLYYGFSNCYLTLFKIENILEGVYQEEDRKYLIANCRIVEDFFERKERQSKVELFIDLNNFKDSESAREFLLNQDYVLCYYNK